MDSVDKMLAPRKILQLKSTKKAKKTTEQQVVFLAI
jgi:hypothetical protein